MEVYLNRIDGIDDAIISMYQSKRSLTRELELEIRDEVSVFTDDQIFRRGQERGVIGEITYLSPKLEKWIHTLLKWGTRHITMLKFIDLSFTVYGMHRGAQDDFDSHAKRFDNRIIRASTRLATFDKEMSDWYKDKIITTDEALEILDIDKPDKIEVNGETYVKAVNGYIKEGFENSTDVMRGLYMLSIPSNFIVRVNLAEFAHVYKERNAKSNANPELKEAVESMAQQLEDATHGLITRELLLEINN